MRIRRRNFLKTFLGAWIAPWGGLGRRGIQGGFTTEKTLNGKRWALAVDLQACWSIEECHACAEACHRIHNVPDFGDPKDEIKWIWTVPYEKAFGDQIVEFLSDELRNKPVVVLCNQCENPLCVKYCPTKATWKRPDGIVQIDYHRCIGCRYCMAGCPYGSRSFNWKNPRPFIRETNLDYPTRTKGVVEKCNFCEERLAEESKPACVESCPVQALIFGDLNDPGSEVRKILRTTRVLRRLPELGTEPKVFYII